MPTRAPRPPLALSLLFACSLAGGGCQPWNYSWGKVRVYESHLGPSSWTVHVGDQGQGAELLVDGSPRRGRCRRTGRGQRCWVGGLAPGFHRLTVGVRGRGYTRRTGLSPKRALADEVFAELLIDRFPDGDTANNIRVNRARPGSPHGGDLKGLRRQLGALRRLGVTSLLLSPVWTPLRFESRPKGLPWFVGHRALQPRRLAPRLGTPKDFLKLLAAARRRRLRVLLDLPRPADYDLEAYFSVARRWLAQSFADGLRLGPVRAGEAAAWAQETHRLTEAHSPLTVIHHGPGVPKLAAPMRSHPPRARLLVVRQQATWLRRFTGCVTPADGPAGPAGLGAYPALADAASLRVLSFHRRPLLHRLCGQGAVARGRADLTLALHLALAGVPQLYYADLLLPPDSVKGLPDVPAGGLRRGKRFGRIRRLLGLRRGLAVLRRGSQRVRVDGDLLLAGRVLGRCQVLLAANRSAKTIRREVDPSSLGWSKRPAGAAAVELVDRLSGRGFTLQGKTLTLELKPGSLLLLVPAGREVCRG